MPSFDSKGLLSSAASLPRDSEQTSKRCTWTQCKDAFELLLRDNEFSFPTTRLVHFHNELVSDIALLLGPFYRAKEVPKRTARKVLHRVNPLLHVVRLQLVCATRRIATYETLQPIPLVGIKGSVF